MVNWIVFDIGGVLVSNGVVNQKLLDYCYQLKIKGFKLGIISNYSASYAAKYHLNDDLFSVSVFADTLKTKKPDPEVFKYFYRQASCLPENCLFFDDNWVNVDSARSVGMKSFLYISLEDLRDKLNQNKICP